MNQEKQNIELAIRGFLVERAWLDPAETLRDKDSLLSQGVIDSMAMTELIGFIEKTYDVRIDDEEMMPENFDSLSSIGAYIRKKQRDRSG